MIYVITQNNEVIFATHLRQTFEDYIDGLCVKYSINETRFDSKVKALKSENINYVFYSPTFKEE